MALDAIDEELLRLLIAGFTVVTRAAAMGRSVEALVDVRLAAVLEDVHLTGGTDHQLRVACRDVPELNRLLRGLRALGVDGIETRLILHQAIDRRG